MTPEQLSFLEYLIASGIPEEQALEIVAAMGGMSPTPPSAPPGEVRFSGNMGLGDETLGGTATGAPAGSGVPAGQRATLADMLTDRQAGVGLVDIPGGNEGGYYPPPPLEAIGTGVLRSIRPGGDTRFGGDSFGADTYMYSPTGDPGERLYEDGSINRPGMPPREPMNMAGQGMMQKQMFAQSGMPIDGIANRMIEMAKKALPAQAAAPAQQNAFGRNPTAVAARNRTVAKPKPSTSSKTAAGPAYRKPATKTPLPITKPSTKKAFSASQLPRIYKD